MRKQMLLT